MGEARQRRPGGRSARTRAAVLTATLAELAEHSYGQVSIESIAERAGVHKTTIYRRWGGKEELVADAFQGAAAERIAVVDTGNIDHDLQALARSVLATLASREGAAVVHAIVSGALESPKVAKVLKGFWAHRLPRIAPLVRAAIDRGELPKGTDSDELLKYLSAPLFQRLLVTIEPLTTADAERSAAAALAAARAGVFVTPLR